MKQLKDLIIVSLVFFGLVGVAHAVSVTKKIQGETTRTAADGGAFTGTYVATGYCDQVKIGVYGNSTNNATNALLYADVASDSTGTRYARSAALGTVGGKSTWYLRTATSATNAPYTRLYLDYSAGFTGSTSIWCTYNDGSR